ncbi:MAG: PilW family protein [Gammaproteobacteria bacterium]|nr:PilW family protein [Gammaproteobacteria bacterium]MDH5617423.1 PilW family protein [Gammaproteobacteria bacterium]
MTYSKVATRQRQTGLTLVEIMVALAIGSFLIIGAVQIYNQSRQAFVVNESIARVQETAQFAMDTIEADLRMASNWGRNSRGLAVEGRSLVGDDNPNGLTEPLSSTGTCGANWAFDLARPIDGNDNAYNLPCSASGGAQANSDLVTIRRATVQPVALEAGRLQVQSTRIQGELFETGGVPAAFSPVTIHPITGAPSSATHNLMVNSYYVSPTSTLIPGVPTLRRKTLTVRAGAPFIDDQEVAPGVENIQLQLGIDVDEDNTVDRYVHPGDDIYNPAAAGYVPGARVMTARVWLVVRGVTAEFGLQDNRNYQPGNANMGQQNDGFRRLQVSKTILLRNART